ncbi:MAG TPA: beta-galactosidase, partial [Sphingobacterium sp.]|nr:beta-galactosidase [Sphingobacterium sp.]
MKKTLFFASLMMAAQLNFAQDWKPAGSHILTPWGEKVTAQKPHPEYPRPQLIRTNNWQNLNGLWKYAVTPVGTKEIPRKWDGNILVPFAIESALSGVGKEVGKDKALWYNNTITLDKSVHKNKVLLHFGAVDWQCDVYVNNQLVGRHEGGFDPFSMDVTSFLKKGAKQEIAIRVWDPTDDGPQPRGKQVNKPNGIWYTPVTGIWQSVWLESV